MESVSVLAFQILNNLLLKLVIIFHGVFTNLFPMVNEAHLLNWFVLNLLIFLQNFSLMEVMLEGENSLSDVISQVLTQMILKVLYLWFDHNVLYI